MNFISDLPLFLIVAARCFALIYTLPLFAARSVSNTAKVALVFYLSFILLPHASGLGYNFGYADEVFSLYFALLLIGEAMIGVIMGFSVSIIFAAFSSAGQFFSFQMGFSASEVYDSLSQVENPLMGQFFNFVALLIFIQTNSFQKLFLNALLSSLSSLNVFSLVESRGEVVRFLISSLSSLFYDALVIALPIMGTLLIISIGTGILSKAAPQMNLLSEGFPLMIMLTFVLLVLLMPSLIDFFILSFQSGIKALISFIFTFKVAS